MPRRVSRCGWFELPTQAPTSRAAESRAAPAPGAQRWLPRSAQGALEVLPLWLFSLMISQWSGPFGTRVLRVNWWAATDAVSRISPYRAWLPDGAVFELPPAAALLLSPLAVGGYLAWQLIWPLVQVLAVRSMLRVAGIRAGWPRLVGGLLVFGAVAPTRDDARLGGIGLVLLALAMVGLVGHRYSPAGERCGPGTGVGLGLAMAVAWLVLGMVVLLLAVGRRRSALTALVTAGLASWMGWLLVPGAASWFARLPSLRAWALPDTGGYCLVGTLDRLLLLSDFGAWLVILSGSLLLALVLVPARRWWLAGYRLLAVGVVGLAGSLVLPIPAAVAVSWVVPAIVGGWRATGLGLPTKVLLWGWFGWLALVPRFDWSADVAAWFGTAVIMLLAIGCVREHQSRHPESRDDRCVPGSGMP